MERNFWCCNLLHVEGILFFLLDGGKWPLPLLGRAAKFGDNRKRLGALLSRVFWAQIFSYGVKFGLR